MTGGRHIKVNHLKTYTKELKRIKGSPFVYLPKAYQKPSPEKSHGKDFKRLLCRLKGKLRTEQGQHEDILRTKKTEQDI